MEIHDKIALKRLKKTLDTSDLPPTPPSPPQQQNGTDMSMQTYKLVGLRKKPDEPLVSFLRWHKHFTFLVYFPETCIIFPGTKNVVSWLYQYNIFYSNLKCFMV